MAAGTYEETLTISKNNIKIYGQNAEIAGNAVRNEEAVLNNTVITLNSSITGTALVGLKFTGTSQVLGLAGAEGASSNIERNHDGFTFKNNYVNSSLTSGNGFIYFVEAASGYTTNPEISYNYFTGSTKTTAYIYLDNNRNLKFNHNVFENVSTDALYVNDKTKGLSGTSVELNNNTFTNINGYAIKINWYSPDKGSSNGVMTFNNNTFTNVTTALYFRSCNNDDKLKKIEIKENVFEGTLDNGIKFDRVVSGITYDISENTFECVPTTSYYNIVSTTSAQYTTTVNVSNNTYKSEGEAIDPESTKILGTGIAK